MAALGRGSPSVELVRVLKKGGCRRAVCKVYTMGGAFGGPLETLRVDRDTYAAVKENEAIALTVMPGRFGWPWVASTAAAAAR